MDWKIILGLLATAVSAIVAGLVGWYSARMRYRQLEFKYEARLKDQYLENARDYIGSVYLPLSISIAGMRLSHRKLQARPEERSRERDFTQAISIFLDTHTSLQEKGGSAFLTSELDEILSSFSSFLEDSLDAVEPSTKILMEVNFPTLIPFSSLFSFKREGAAVRSPGPIKKIEHSVLGLRIYGVEELVSAPTTTTDFERRFVRDVFRIDRLVKDVTLGSNGRSVTSV